MKYFYKLSELKQGDEIIVEFGQSGVEAVVLDNSLKTKTLCVKIFHTRVYTWKYRENYFQNHRL